MKYPFWNGCSLQDMLIFGGGINDGSILPQRSPALTAAERAEAQSWRFFVETFSNDDLLQGKSRHGWLDRSFGGGAYESMGLGTYYYASFLTKYMRLASIAQHCWENRMNDYLQAPKSNSFQ